jgi:predicted dehydrogenase
MKRVKTRNKVLISRRDFLKRTALAAAPVALAGPAVIPSSVLGATAPSNRTTIGCIGVGGQGIWNMQGFISKPQAQVLAVCDVDRNHLEGARTTAGLNAKSAYTNYRELLAREDIDAVVVSTPDHWHVPISVAAAKAGKDIYCEKPLTLTVAEGRALCNAAKRYGRVFQTGSQQRSDNRFRFACELVRNGRIGKLHTIHVQIPKNSRTNPLDWHTEPVPPHLNYDMWLGPAPWVPYTEMRCHYSFRFLLDYSGGQITNWGAHYLDIAQWANGTDRTGPVQILGRGEFPKTGLFTTATNVYVEYTYTDGVKLICATKPDDISDGSIRFEGNDGWVYVDRSGIDGYPKSLLTSIIVPHEVHLYHSTDHQQDFLNCVKLRRTCAADVEIGHRSASICHLGNIAMLLGRKLKWDPGEERFIDDAAANRMLARSMRAPWRL